MMGDIDIYRVLMIAGVMALQYFFSTRNSVYWGAIIPAVFLVWTSSMYATHHIVSFKGFIILLLVGMLFLIIEWEEGRKYLHKKQAKELDKIKAHDMK